MEIFRRVKRYLAPAEYNALDKRNREVIGKDGEVERFPTHDAEGRELPDPVPMAPAVGFVQNPSMFDVMRDMIRGERLRAYAELQGSETWEEAQDFSVDEDEFPTSPFEGEFEPMEDMMARREQRFRSRFIEEEEDGRYKDWREKAIQAQRDQAGPFVRQGRDSAAEGGRQPLDGPGKGKSSKGRAAATDDPPTAD